MSRAPRLETDGAGRQASMDVNASAALEPSLHGGEASQTFSDRTSSVSDRPTGRGKSYATPKSSQPAFASHTSSSPWVDSQDIWSDRFAQPDSNGNSHSSSLKDAAWQEVKATLETVKRAPWVAIVPILLLVSLLVAGTLGELAHALLAHCDEVQPPAGRPPASSLRRRPLTRLTAAASLLT